MLFALCGLVAAHIRKGCINIDLLQTAILSILCTDIHNAVGGHECEECVVLSLVLVQ